ncbi:MAG: FHA domain-containing protein [candidate division WOR-3 bacterium]
MRLIVKFPDGTLLEREMNGNSIRIGNGSEIEVSLPGLQPLEATIHKIGGRFKIAPAENARVYLGRERVLLPKFITPDDEIGIGKYSLRIEIPAPQETSQENPPVISEPKDDLQNEVDTAPTEFLELPPEIVPRLQVTGGPDQGKTFEILGTAVLGRDLSADFVLTDRFVSRHHLRFYLNEDGSVVVEDIGGKNPVLINGRVMPKKVLIHGDVIRVGKTELLFFYEAQGFAEEARPRPRIRPWVWASAGAALLFGVLAITSWVIFSKNSLSARKQQAHMLMVQAEAAQSPSDKARLYSRSVSIFEALSKRAPNDPEIAEGLRVASLNQRLWTHIINAEENLKAGDYMASVREADAALAEAPDNPQALRLRDEATAKLFIATYEAEARKSLSAGDPASAVIYAELALSASPWDESLLSLKDSCAKALSEVKDKSPSDQTALLSAIRKKHYRDADPEATLEMAKKILSQNPDDPAALYYKTIAEMEIAALEAEKNGRVDEAAELWRRIARIEPTNPLARKRAK